MFAGSERRAILAVTAQVAFLFAATPAWADAGSPLVWTAAFHLLVGNLLIGVLEGVVVARVFKLPRARTVALLIPANYFSAFVGVALTGAVEKLIVRFDPAPLYHVGGLLLGVLFGSYVVSALLEWPFCLAAAWRSPDRVRTSAKATILAQTVSYPILVVLYLAGPAVTGPRGVELDSSLSFATQVRATVYFVPPGGGSVWRIRPDGTGRERVWEGTLTPDEGLKFRPSADQAHWDLWSRKRPGLLANAVAPLEPGPRAKREAEAYEEMGFVTPIDLRGNGSAWSVWAEVWPDVGLVARNRRSGESVSMAVGTPLLVWSASWATALPDDKVVFELGEQVVVLDLASRKAGVITAGCSPAVLLSPE